MNDTAAVAAAGIGLLYTIHINRTNKLATRPDKLDNMLYTTVTVGRRTFKVGPSTHCVIYRDRLLLLNYMTPIARLNNFREIRETT